MRKINVYRCPECRKPFKTLGGWANHMNIAHPEVRPKGYSDSRFFYYILTGKTHGNCIVCKKPTEWNEETGKYNRFCNNPKCKQTYREEFKKRMISRYGKVTLLDDPEFARKALDHRRISGHYTFRDGGKLSYVGSYEKDFLRMMDIMLNYKSSDIMAPSPHTYYYMYEGEKHYYIPDFYIPNLNLEIEVKQNQSKHPKILAVDKVKEKEKDKVMKTNSKVNYLKIVDKNYEPIIEYLLRLKEQVPNQDALRSDEEKEKIVQESLYKETDDRREAIMEAFLMNEAEEPAQEGYFKDSEAIEYRVDVFKNRGENLLFITGLSGSGKSTLAKKMAKEYDATYIMLDDIMVPGHFTDAQLKEYHPLILEYFTKTPNGKKYRDTKEFTDYGMLTLLPDFIKYIVNNAGNQCFIIEGLYFIHPKFFNNTQKYLKDHSCIILGTSLVKSGYRRMKRNAGYPKQNQHSFLELFIASILTDPEWEKNCEKLRKIISEWNSIAQESNTKDSSMQHAYFLSEKNMDQKILTPRIPKNYFTENGYEENKTPRVCFSTSISGALMGLSQNLDKKVFYVHIPENADLVPAKNVPDSKITGEIWSLKNTKVYTIGKIQVSKNDKPGHKFSYGDGKEAELFPWDYKWIEKYSVAQEALVGSFIDTRPYDNPIPTPAPEPAYDPVNVIPSKAAGGPGALLKSDRVVKAMVPCVLDEISGEPADGMKPLLLPVEDINANSTADPKTDKDEVVTDRDMAEKKAIKICEKFEDYSILNRKKKIEELKDLILKWNLDLDLSKYPKVKRGILLANKPAQESYTPGYILDYFGPVFEEEMDSVLENRLENPDDLHPVYILLTHSSTLLANIIKKFTGDKYSHAAICFDPSFKTFYTFGRKKGGGGFSIEGPEIDFYKQRPNVPYGIYVTFVSSPQYKAMKKKLQFFVDNERKFKYHFVGLAKIAVGLPSENPTHYFCSGFVVDVLQAGGISKSRSYTLFKPQDLTHLYASYKIEEGHGLSNIIKKNIIEKTNEAKEKFIKRFSK